MEKELLEEKKEQHVDEAPKEEESLVHHQQPAADAVADKKACCHNDKQEHKSEEHKEHHHKSEHHHHDEEKEVLDVEPTRKLKRCCSRNLRETKCHLRPNFRTNTLNTLISGEEERPQWLAENREGIQKKVAGSYAGTTIRAIGFFRLVSS